MCEAPELPSCQICLEASESSDGTLLTRLCGSQCEARICRQCLTNHVRNSLERFYAGVVPRVRCPICLKPMSKRQWQFSLVRTDSGREESANDAHALVDRYEILCRQACGLMSPCCHKADYSHLPNAASNTSSRGADEFNEAAMAITSEGTSSIAQLWSLGLEFQAHRQPPQVLIKLLLQTFSKTETMASKALDALLTRIQDDERRATLLLAFLAVRPLCSTRCCDHRFCFNCKKGSHHRVCDNDREINLTENMIQCRSCRATLVKVEGCSSVTCLCGFNMNWDQELVQFKFIAKQMVSEDVYFNAELFAAWLEWRNQAPLRRNAIASAYTQYRTKMLETCLVQYCHVLRPRIRHFVQHWRFRHNVVKRISAAWLQMQVKYYARKLATSQQEQEAPELALLTSNPSERLSISTAASVPNHRRSRLSEQRARGQTARERSRDRRQKARRAQKNLLLYVKTSDRKEIPGHGKWTSTECSMIYTPTLVPATRKFVPKRRAVSAARWR